MTVVAPLVDRLRACAGEELSKTESARRLGIDPNTAAVVARKNGIAFISGQPPVIEPVGRLKPQRWHARAIALRQAGVGRREIALSLGLALNSVTLLFSEKARRSSWERRLAQRAMTRQAARVAHQPEARP